MLYGWYIHANRILHIHLWGYGWQLRCLSHVQEEFEAETVAWLVCERMNIYNPSEGYLCHYTDNEGTLPPMDLNIILTAVKTIEQMISDSPSQAVTNGLLYRHSQSFKNKVDTIKKEYNQRNRIKK